MDSHGDLKRRGSKAVRPREARDKKPRLSQSSRPAPVQPAPVEPAPREPSPQAQAPQTTPLRPEAPANASQIPPFADLPYGESPAREDFLTSAIKESRLLFDQYIQERHDLKVATRHGENKRDIFRLGELQEQMATELLYSQIELASLLAPQGWWRCRPESLEALTVEIPDVFCRDLQFQVEQARAKLFSVAPPEPVQPSPGTAGTLAYVTPQTLNADRRVTRSLAKSDSAASRPSLVGKTSQKRKRQADDNASPLERRPPAPASKRQTKLLWTAGNKLGPSGLSKVSAAPSQAQVPGPVAAPKRQTKILWTADNILGVSGLPKLSAAPSRPAVPDPAKKDALDADPTEDQDSANDPDWESFGNLLAGLEDDDNVSVNEGNTSVAGSNGLIYVGNRSLQAHASYVRSIPKEVVKHKLGTAVHGAFKRLDGTFEGFHPAVATELRDALLDWTLGTLDEARSGRLRRRCDYSGLEIVWSNGPRNASLEAIYPSVRVQGHLGYHALPNSCVAMFSLNSVKRLHPVIVLPLLTVALKATAEVDFVKRRRQLTWAYNAMSNAAICCRLFSLGKNHKLQIADWARWDEAQLQTVLEALRTGRRSPMVDELLARQSIAKVFEPPMQLVKAIVAGRNWSRVLSTLRAIAASYGVDEDEFDYYLTIPSPWGGVRVFFPFHVLSRPQAQAINWDWEHTVGLSTFLLYTMQSACNRNAEKAGLGEKDLDGMVVLYWMAAHFGQKIQRLKAVFPEAPWTTHREEILFSILDRWGLPIVPWIGHLFRASLCKGPDHGIAMIFGITRQAGEEFDPLRHIDLSRCTVTLDTGATNFAMYSWQPTAWDDIKEVMASVPLHHPMWRVDSCMGDAIWRPGGSFVPDHEPIAPVPEFTTPLLPLDDWTSGDGLHGNGPFTCHLCDEGFKAAGELIHHMRRGHDQTLDSDDDDDTPIDAGQEEAEDKFWSNLTCQTCGKIFPSRSHLAVHRLIHTGERPFVCEECGEGFNNPGGLLKHRVVHSDELPFKCDDCGAGFKLAQALKAHHEEVHLNHRKFLCDICGDSFNQKMGLDKHLRRVHPDGKMLACEVCGTTFKDQRAHRAHEKTAHNPKFPWKCKICGTGFKAPSLLTRHESVHSDDQPYKCDICGVKFKKEKFLELHRENKHSE